MVKHYWQRHEDFRAAILAAREALDAAERAEETYYGIVVQPHQPKAYIMAEREQSAARLADRAIEETLEAAGHLADAIGAWWEHRRPDWTGRG